MGINYKEQDFAEVVREHTEDKELPVSAHACFLLASVDLPRYRPRTGHLVQGANHCFLSLLPAPPLSCPAVILSCSACKLSSMQMQCHSA